MIFSYEKTQRDANPRPGQCPEEAMKKKHNSFMDDIQWAKTQRDAPPKRGQHPEAFSRHISTRNKKGIVTVKNWKTFGIFGEHARQNSTAEVGNDCTTVPSWSWSWPSCDTRIQA